MKWLPCFVMLLSCGGAMTAAPARRPRSASTPYVFEINADGVRTLDFDDARAVRHAFERALIQAGYGVASGETKAHAIAKLGGAADGERWDPALLQIVAGEQLVVALAANDAGTLAATAVELVDQLTASNLAALSPNTPPAPAPAERADTVVAVFDIDDATSKTDPGVLRQLGDYLGARLAAAPGVRVVPRDQLRSMLAETKAESYRACFEQACQIELGKALSAQKSLATKLLRVGRNCAMTSTLFDLKTETTERAATTQAECSDDGLFAAIEELALQLGAPKRAEKTIVKPAKPIEQPALLTLEETPPPREPAPPAPFVVKWTSKRDHRILVLPAPISFAHNKDELSDNARSTLDQVADALASRKQKLTIAGHADPLEQGPAGLSERRARNVRTYLIKRGMKIDRFILVASGISEPAGMNQNRRVELREPSAGDE